MSISHNLATKSFCFSYNFENTEWSVAIPAESVEEATKRVKALATARYDGELLGGLAVSPGPLHRLAAWINKVSLLK